MLRELMHLLMRPRLLMGISRASFPVLLLCAILSLLLGGYYALFGSPGDYQHGDYVRIMYVHVPAAWLSIAIYVLMGVSSFLYLWQKNPVFHYLPKAAVSLGLFFTSLCLITGSLWGKVAWGTYWVWDARLTSMFILLLIYVGYFLLVTSFKDEEEGLKFGHYLLLIGLINVPIIKFSVTWWYTLHQPASIMKFAASSIHPSMLMPLGFMFLGFALFFFAFLLLNLRRIFVLAKIKRLTACDMPLHQKMHTLSERNS